MDFVWILVLNLAFAQDFAYDGDKGTNKTNVFYIVYSVLQCKSM